MTEILISRVRFRGGAKIVVQDSVALARLAVNEDGVSIVSIAPSLDRGSLESAIASVGRDGVWGLAPGRDGRSHDFVRLAPSDGRWFAEEFARRLSPHLPRESEATTRLVAHLPREVETSLGFQLYVLGSTAIGIAIACASVMQTWTGVLLGVSVAIAFFSSWQLARARGLPTLAFWHLAFRLLLVSIGLVLLGFVVRAAMPGVGSRFDAWTASLRPRDEPWRFGVLVFLATVEGVVAFAAQRRPLRVLLWGATLLTSGLVFAVLLVDAVLRNL